MKRLLVGLAAAVFLLPAILQAAEPAAALTENKAKEFTVYTDKNARENHFAPSGWIGDYGDIRLNDQSLDNPHSGISCIQFAYSAKTTQAKGWAGVYWQNPANNWGAKKGGFDLSEMTKLTFWARGAKGGELIQKFIVGGIGISSRATYPDSF